MNSFQKDFPQTYSWLNEEVELLDEIVLAASIMAIYKLYKRYISDIGKKCNMFKGDRYKKCYSDVKISGTKYSIR